MLDEQNFVTISQSAAELNILGQFTVLVQENLLLYFFRKFCFISATSEYEFLQALTKKSDQPHLSEQEIYLRD